MAIKDLVKGFCKESKCAYDVYTKEKMDEILTENKTVSMEQLKLDGQVIITEHGSSSPTTFDCDDIPFTIYKCGNNVDVCMNLDIKRVGETNNAIVTDSGIYVNLSSGKAFNIVIKIKETEDLEGLYDKYGSLYNNLAWVFSDAGTGADDYMTSTVINYIAKFIIDLSNFEFIVDVRSNIENCIPLHASYHCIG